MQTSKEFFDDLVGRMEHAEVVVTFVRTKMGSYILCSQENVDAAFLGEASKAINNEIKNLKSS